MARYNRNFRPMAFLMKVYLFITSFIGNVLIINGFSMGTLKYDFMRILDAIINIIATITKGT